jgi:acyl-CoA thioesterase I
MAVYPAERGRKTIPPLGEPVRSAAVQMLIAMPLRYVALGDSYTIGTSVDAPERWPDLLAAALRNDPVRLELVANLGVSGFTSADVVAVELPRLDDLKPGFVTLLIGVNDVVRGVPEATFRERVGAILGTLRGRLPADRILVVTTPDYTVTPAGADYGDPTVRRAGIRRVNAIVTEVARALGIAVVDVFDISAGAATDRSLVARDGLHPSGRQYGLWVERIAPVVRSLIGSAWR